MINSKTSIKLKIAKLKREHRRLLREGKPHAAAIKKILSKKWKIEDKIIALKSLI